MRYLVVHRIGYEERTMCTMVIFPHPPKVKFGEEFDWNADRRAVHLSWILDGGPEHTQPLQIYILEEALMDEWRLAGRTGKPKTDEMVNLAKLRWKSLICPIVTGLGRFTST